jgi:hypothetical protein
MSTAHLPAPPVSQVDGPALYPAAAMHACTTTCQPLWASAPPASRPHVDQGPSPLSASVGDRISEPCARQRADLQKLRTREALSSPPLTLLRTCEASNTRATCGGGPCPSLSHAAACTCGWPDGDFAVIVLDQQVHDAGLLKINCELGMTMGASETRFVRCHAFSTPRLELPFAREVNMNQARHPSSRLAPSASLSG